MAGRESTNPVTRAAIIIACMLLLGACRPGRNADFENQYAADRANRHIVLSVLTDPSEIANNTSINLLLENRSEWQIAIPDDFGAKLFAYVGDGRGWVEVENGVDYSPPPEPYILAPESDVPFNQKVFPVRPRIAGEIAATYLRIVVEGTILAGAESIETSVAAYVEVEIGR